MTRLLPVFATRCLLVAIGLLLSMFLGAHRASADARIGAPISVSEDPDDSPSPKRLSPSSKEKRGSSEKPPTAEAKPVAPPPPAEKPAEVAPAPATAIVLGATTAVLLPTDSERTIVEHWQKRLENLSNNDTKRVEEEERAIEHIKRELALENMLTASAALLREADTALQKKQPGEALAKCREAEKLSPAMNLVYLCIARASFARDMTDIGGTLSALNKALSATWRDVRSRRNAFADFALTLLFGLATACGALVVLVIARYARVFIHDFHHLFPQGVSQWQSVLVATVLFLLPALLGFGLLGSVALAAVGVALFLGRSEAIAVAAAFVLIAIAQYAEGDVLQAGAFGRTAQDVYLMERGDAPEAAALRLQSRTDNGLGNYATAYALGHYHKRFGRLAEAKAAYEAAKKIRETPELLNNIANVLFLQGDTENAKKLYNDANQKNPGLPAPMWNLAKLYYREGKLEQGQKIQEQARAVDPEGATASAGEANVSAEPEANTYMMDVPLSDHEITRLADEEANAIVSGGGATWSALSGRGGTGVAIAVALLTALIVAAGQALQMRLHPSSYCERCGRPVCVRCDPELGQTKGMCGQCISVFVRRTGVDGPDRLRKEIEVRQFRRRQRLFVRGLGAILGGGGHIFAGRILGGAAFLTCFCLLLAQVLFWHGILRSPMPVQLSSSGWHVAFYVVGFLALCGGSLLHLMRFEEAD